MFPVLTIGPKPSSPCVLLDQRLPVEVGVELFYRYFQDFKQPNCVLSTILAFHLVIPVLVYRLKIRLAVTDFIVKIQAKNEQFGRHGVQTGWTFAFLNLKETPWLNDPLIAICTASGTQI